MSQVLEKIEAYYDEKQKKKIFCRKICVEGRMFQILYDYDKSNEIDKFVSNFASYLPYYVYNADNLEYVEIDKGIEEELLRLSKTIKLYSPSVPDRKPESNGIFGEVFLDFYERIVKKDKVMTAYASRRDFKSNQENKGFDNMLFNIVDGQIEYIFAESKFVVNRSNAVKELINDVKGNSSEDGTYDKPGHLTKDFMNDYIHFVVEKSCFFSDDDKSIAKPFFKELNKVLINGDMQFVPFLVERDVRIRCVFFAIFQHKSFEPEDFMDSFDKIEKEAKEHLKKIGFKNYIIEIVFIPTKSKSMEIKRAIEAYYE